MCRRTACKLIFLGILLFALYKNQELFAAEEEIIGVSYDCPDGENEYYIRTPYFEVENQSLEAEIRYEFCNGLDEWSQGQISPGENKNFASYFKDGENQVRIWKQENDGSRRMEESYTFYVDTTPVFAEIVIENERNGWCKEEAVLHIFLEDGGTANYKSGIKQVSYYVNGVETAVDQEQKMYLKETANVAVETLDYAGNQAVYEKNVYVDTNSPQVQITLEETGKVTSKDVKVNFRVKEEEGLQSVEAKAVWTRIDGSTEEHLYETWQMDGSEARQDIVLTEEGRYSLWLKATDRAGNVAEDEKEILIDKTGPDVFWLKDLGGKRVRKVEIPREGKELYQDFTSCRWQVWLDDKACQKGKVVKEEGNHHLKVQVEDSAGNVTEEDVNFVIDRTAPKIQVHGIENHQITTQEVCLRIETENKKDWISKVLINKQEEG